MKKGKKEGRKKVISMEHLWNDADKENRSNHRKTCPAATFAQFHMD
jgi:hypothetical protein